MKEECMMYYDEWTFCHTF